MSPTEIIQQTWAPYGGSAAGLYSLIGKNGVGQASFGRAQGPSIQARVEARNDIQKRVMASSAHGVPVSFSNEALHSAIAGGTVASLPALYDGQKPVVSTSTLKSMPSVILPKAPLPNSLTKLLV